MPARPLRRSETRRRAPRAAVAWAAVLASASLLLFVLPSRAGATDGWERFSGTWIYAGSEAESQARIDAIQAAVGQMPRLFRPFAFRRIDRATTPPPRLVLRVEAGRITIADGDGPGLTTPLGGEGVVIDGDGGDPQTVTRTPSGDAIRHRAEQHNGFGQDVFRLSADGETLTDTVTVGSDQLPAEIVYVLTYRRER